MKLKLSFIAFLTFCLGINAQVTNVDLSLQPNYSDEVYYNLDTNSSSAYNASDWELAFLRTSQFGFATRINDAIGITVFEASNNPADWDAIDIADINTWTQLYNSDTTWEVGALDNGSATYGWGEYNATTHHVEGTVTYVLSYADGSYKKLMIEDFYNGYTFKYADWDATTSTWGADETYVLPNSTNPDRLFNYYNLSTDAEVIAEPESTAWDLIFKKYTTLLEGGTMYTVIGVLHHPDITVAENVEPNGDGDTSNLEYSGEINTIGHDWKEFNMNTFQYDIAADTYYYVKTENETVYRLHFTAFEGSSTGNLSFNYEDVTSSLSTTNFDNENSFSVFPNPSTDKMVNILYEISKTQESAPVVQVYNVNGQKVYENQLQNDGFYNQKLDLTQLSAGIYLLKFNSGNFSTTKKIVLK